ncbi:DUF4307 domain-containing protein [Hoyosella rhizosphaerae]|uniref:DUF4307 domain-containing protein n=1 Tax=Hoyosella rhizosphaerae TaxID=1755582 RepID=A0A916UDV9_9ACTN|nr:DUF4307 domain-containing protein [Hoyosella rhizosphaerae]MBN4925677.1 DUF4307 domain-containing protein [Hoyosella rhizosphaerae]GGC68770.1 hypothetical protein GCM10011410_21960 [Hoyosella rhizosphaerae]
MTSGNYSAASRYPTRNTKPKPRWLIIVVAGVFAGVVATITFVGYRPVTSTPITAESLAYEVIDDQTINIRFKVVRDDPSDDVVCVVRARSRDGSETGRREIYLPPSESAAVELTTHITTSQAPGMAEVYGCSANVPDYLLP